MIEKSLWQKIKDVVDYDKKISTLQENIAHLKDGIEKKHQNIIQKDVVLNKTRRNLNSMKKSTHEKDLILADLKENEATRRKQLDDVKKQKDYKALEKEIENIVTKRVHQEEMVDKQWYSIEEAKKELEDLEKTYTETVSQLKHDMQLKEENIKQLEGKLEEEILQRNISTQKLPIEWLSQYERMKHSVTDPIVPVLNNGCSACFYSVPFQDISKLKKSKIILCKNCYRFLYYDEDEEKASHEASY